MDLPKNVTQIGETNHGCKIYVEDYVISYIKQLNGHALDKGLAVALYGVRKEEAGITYLFFYGAAKLNFLQRETRHLSQAVLQEAEKTRKRYFGEYVFLGYRLLDGEMVEGFHVYEQGVCRYIEGYAQFYEKNDSMLRFMLEERQEEVKPEEFDQEKYDVVKRRQEERRSRAEEAGHARRVYRESGRAGKRGKAADVRLRRMKTAAAAIFILLCITGLATVDGGEKLDELQAAARDMIDSFSERQLPDAVEVSNGGAQVGTIVAEDRLTDAILKENEAVQKPEADQPSNADTSPNPERTPEPQPTPISQPRQTPEPTPTSQSGQTPEPTPTSEPGRTPEPPLTSQSGQTPEPPPASESGQTPEPTPTPEPEPVSYTVRRGDTLIGICLARYGSDARVAEICTLNNISNPDNIKVGEKILLPQ